MNSILLTGNALYHRAMLFTGVNVAWIGILLLTLGRIRLAIVDSLSLCSSAFSCG